MFKSGDKVRYIGDSSVHLKYGQVGTITYADEYHVAVVFIPAWMLITGNCFRDLEFATMTIAPSEEAQKENLSIWDTLAE